MRTPVTFYSEGVKLVGDVYHPPDLRPGALRAGIVLCHGYTGVKDLYLPDNARIPRIVQDLGGSIDRVRAAAKLHPPRPSPFTLCLEALDDLGLLAANLMSLWRKALLGPKAPLPPAGEGGTQRAALGG